MKRTGEKALIIIGSILNLLTMILSLVAISVTKVVLNDPDVAQTIVDTIEENPQEGVEPLDVAEVQSLLETATPFVNGFGWSIVIFALISIILGIVAYVYLSKKGKEKTAGGLLIGAGVAGGIISLTAILYYIAAIMCFVRKEKMIEKIED